MELINKKYVKMHKCDIFIQMVKAGATEKVQDNEKVEYFQTLLTNVINYEKETKSRIEEFYIPIEDIDINDAEVTREIIINALVYASISKNFKMIQKITPYLYAKNYKLSIGNKIIEYILEHGINVDEFIDGEEEKLIYNKEQETFSYGYIHNHYVKLERRKK